MQKTFDITISDQPFKQTTELNKSITVEYDGDRFVLIIIHPVTGRFVRTALTWEDDCPIQNIDDYNNDFETPAVIDAQTHSLESAFFTGRYKFINSHPYEETLPDGEIWIYDYIDLGDIFDFSEMTYDKNTKTFSNIPFRSHHLSRTDFQNATDTNIDYAKSILKDQSDPVVIEKINNYIKMIEQKNKLFENTDFWKIPGDPDLLEYLQDQDSTS